MAQLVEIAGAVASPIGLSQAKMHLRLDDNAEDELIEVLIGAARDEAEGLLRKRFVARRFDILFDSFACLQLPIAPVRKVVSVGYVDTAGAVQTVSASNYVAETREEPCVIVPKLGATWPIPDSRPGAVRVRFVAGFCASFSADASTDVITAPDHWFADGDAVQAWNHSGALPASLAPRTTYYVRDVSGDTLKLAATSGGSAINITSAGSGFHFIGVYPDAARIAMMLMLTHWFENRSTVAGTFADRFEVPLSAHSLLMPLRLPTH